MIMEIKISVDETKFKEVIEKELNAFSREELHDIIRECIVEALRNDDVLKNLFITTDTYCGYITTQPSEILKIAAKNIDLSPAYKYIQESMISTLKENYHSLLESVMLNMIISGLCSNYNFTEMMANSIKDIVRKGRN